MSETRKLFPAPDGTLWMELFPHELEAFKEVPERVRWFGPVPCSHVTIRKKEEMKDGEFSGADKGLEAGRGV